MSLALPSALLLGLLALPIVVFYILKVRLRRVPVSTNLFWKQIYEEKPPRSIWQYLRHLLSLLVQLLLLLLLVLAISDPRFAWQEKQARRLVVVIDSSASMQASDVEPTRFDHAISKAIQLVDGLRYNDEMAIILAGTKAEVAIGMSSHAPTLKRVLNELKVTDNPTSLLPAVELGHKLIGDHPRGQIVVYSDGCSKDVEKLMPHSEKPKDSKTKSSKVESSNPKEQEQKFPKVAFHLVGTKTSNVGITQFQVRRSMIDPRGYEILVEVLNASDSPLQCRLEIELEGSTVDVLPLKLKPNETWHRSLEKTSLGGGLLVSSLKRIRELEQKPDNAGSADDKEASNKKTSNDKAEVVTLNALTSDDQAWAILPSREIQRVLIVSPGNLFLHKVFEANPLVQLTIVKEAPEQWPANSIIVLHKIVPKNFPKGNIFVIDPENESEFWEVGKPLENPIITDIDKDSPLMTHLRLDNVVMPETKKLKFTQKPHVLAGSVSGDSIYTQLTTPTSKILVLSVNLEKGDLAFRTAFPILVTNSLSFFAGNSGELSQSISTGEIARLKLPAEKFTKDSEWAIQSPSGEKSNVTEWINTHLNTSDKPSEANPKSPSGESKVASNLADKKALSPEEKNTSPLVLGPFKEAGVWKIVSLDGKTSQDASDASDPQNSEALISLAVNIASAQESDLRPDSELLNEEVPASVFAGWFARPIWYYLIAFACVGLLLEWFLYQRRFIN